MNIEVKIRDCPGAFGTDGGSVYSLTCNSVGTAPGCMLLEEEYSLGSRLLRVHRRHLELIHPRKSFHASGAGEYLN